MNYSRIVLVPVVMMLTGCAGLFFSDTSFSVLETNHFTFFYVEGSKSADEIGSIAKYSENAVKWFYAYTGIKFTVKPDVYIYDEGSDNSYNTLFGIIDSSMLESHSTKGVITYYYQENNYLEASVTILHESIHVVQEYLLGLKDTGIAEGHATFLSLKYYYYIENSGYADEDIFNLLKSYVAESIDEDGLPDYIFGLTLPQFNRLEASDSLSRDPGRRYEICESFIVYLVMQYGITKVDKWLEGTTIDNFKTRYKTVFDRDIEDDQDDWYAAVQEE